MKVSRCRRFSTQTAHSVMEALEPRILLDGALWSMFDYGFYVAEAGDGNLITAGSSTLYNGAGDAYVGLISADGEVTDTSYIGGTGGTNAEGVAVDGDGNIYITGWTNADDIPTALNAFNATPGQYDSYVAKLSADGTLQWVTYVGGNGDDCSADIALDADGNIYIAGQTDSSELVGYLGGAYDGFAAKINTLGEISWIKCLGGAGYEYANSVTFNTDSIFVTASVANDGAVYKLALADGATTWTATITGSDADDIRALTFDAANDIFVTGSTASNDLLSANNTYIGGVDAYIAKISAAGAVQWSSYIGGTLIDVGDGIEVNDDGTVIIIGQTNSTDFESADNSFNGGAFDAFIARCSATTGEVEWSSYLGGEGEDSGYSLIIDSSDNAYVTGITYSQKFTRSTNDPVAGPCGFLTKVSQWSNDLAVNGSTPTTYTDSDGNIVTVKVKGPGTATLSFWEAGNRDLDNLTVTGATSKTSVMMTINERGAQTNVYSIDIDGALKSFTGKAVILTGTFTSSEGVSKLTLAGVDTVNQATITIGDPLVPPVSSATVSLSLGDITNLTLSSEYGIKTFKALSWDDTSDTADSISAPWIGSINVSGDFYANINLDDAADSTKALKSFRANYVGNIAVSTNGEIRKIRCLEWLGGTVDAAWVNKLIVTGDTVRALDGNFGATLTVTDGAVLDVFAKAKVAGAIAQL